MVRPRKELDEDEFRKLIAMIQIQCTAEEIAGVLNVSVDTLDRRLKEANEGGFADFQRKHGGQGKASLRRMQWKAAEAGNPTMLIWLGKQILNQRDRIQAEHTGPDGGALQVQMIERRIVDPND